MKHMGILFIFAAQLMVSYSAMAENKRMSNIQVIALYQIEDESDAGFDFFSSKKLHKCGGKESNRFRSYSDNENINERKFSLIESALNHHHRITVVTMGCEGRTMLVGAIGIAHSIQRKQP